MRVTAPADKRFRRPHVKPARRRRRWSAHVLPLLKVLATVSVLGWSAYVVARQVVHAESLHVSRIVVRGNERLPTGEVLALLAGLRGQHVLEVDLDAWRRRVLGSAWVERAALRRLLPATVEVYVEERRPIAVGRLGSDLYLVDALGRVIDEYGPNYAEFDLPIVDGLGSSPPAGEPMVDEQRAALAHDVIESLRTQPELFRRVSQIDVTNARDAVVVLQDDTALLHLGDDRFVDRLQSYVDLAPALREQVPEMEYADLRFENRVYVRPAGAGRRGARR
jgi:cell division septal protein FtsQ